MELYTIDNRLPTEELVADFQSCRIPYVQITGRAARRREATLYKRARLALIRTSIAYHPADSNPHLLVEVRAARSAAAVACCENRIVRSIARFGRSRRSRTTGSLERERAVDDAFDRGSTLLPGGDQSVVGAVQNKNRRATPHMMERDGPRLIWVELIHRDRSCHLARGQSTKRGTRKNSIHCQLTIEK